MTSTPVADLTRERAVVRRIELDPARRILVVSDIHGNLPALRQVLAQAGFGSRDELFLLGDYIEKGPGSLDCLHFLMEFSQRANVHMLMGNCDTVWEDVLTDGETNTLSYLKYRPDSILHEMCAEVGFAVSDGTDIRDLRRALRPRFRPEMEFLRGLPHILETERYLFAHAALSSERLGEQIAWDVMKNDGFLKTAPAFHRWLFVGHLPTNNYCKTIGCVNPIVDRERRIVSIDGGNVIRTGGQLNLFCIENGKFSFQSADSLPEAAVRAAQEASENPVYVPWFENAIELLEEGEELSFCRLRSSGHKLLVANEELMRYRDGSLHCGEATDYLLPLSPGERVKVVRRYRSRSFCKQDGVLGWVVNDRLDAPERLPQGSGRPPYAP